MLSNPWPLSRPLWAITDACGSILSNLALGHGGGAGEATEGVYTTWGLSQRAFAKPGAKLIGRRCHQCAFANYH